MNIIEGQAKQKRNASLIFYSLTFDNILNIIVLLILAGVSIAMLTGQNGILTQAKKTSEETLVAKEKEEISNAYTQAKMEKLTKDDKNPITSTDISNELTTNGVKDIKDVTGIGKITITYTNGHTYIIGSNGEISNETEYTVPDDFWVIDDGGTLSINYEYLTEKGTVIGRYSSSTVKTYECDYTKLDIPLEFNGKRVEGVKLPVITNVTNVKGYMINPLNEESIGSFESWTGLISANIAGNISSSCTFTNCTNLKNVNIKSLDYNHNNQEYYDSRLYFSYREFENCINLETVSFSTNNNSMSGYYSSVFENCPKLKTIYADDVEYVKEHIGAYYPEIEVRPYSEAPQF